VFEVIGLVLLGFWFGWERRSEKARWDEREKEDEGYPW
jgi:hypothetical protein